VQGDVRAGSRDLAGILGPVLLKLHASRRCLIAAAGRFNTGALLASTRIFGSLAAAA
jgi:hypothetical protein